MMDGRVKTLHPKIHGGILARRHRPDDLEAIAAQGIELVDLVVVNLYPFAKAAQNPETPFDELVEEIDIGGPSLLRAAGKNFRDVLVVVDPADYPTVLEQLARPGGPSLEFRFELMQKAFAHTAQFDALIAHDDGRRSTCDGTTTSCAGCRPAARDRRCRRPLRYGENPHQKAAWIQGHGPTGRLGVGRSTRARSCPTPTCSISTPRSASRSSSPSRRRSSSSTRTRAASRPGATIAEAYVRAREADPLSAFGGIVGLNRADRRRRPRRR